MPSRQTRCGPAGLGASDDSAGRRSGHVLRGVPANLRALRRRGCSPRSRRQRHADLAAVRQQGPAARRGPGPARDRPRRHGRPDDDEPAGVPSRGHGGVPSRGGAILGVQHVRARPGPACAGRRRQPGGDLRGAVRETAAGRRRRDRDPARRVRGRRARPRAHARRGHGRRRPGIRARHILARGPARRPADPNLHLGHHRPAEGDRDHARANARMAERDRRGDARPPSRPARVLSADGARHRTLHVTLHAHDQCSASVFGPDN
jgi:hypothetical protein